MDNSRFKFRVVRGKNPFTPEGTILHFALGDEVGFGQGDVIEQCTGLKDKNGKLIYEGDVIHDLGEIEPICSLPLIVRWDDRTAGFYLDHQKIGMRASLGRIDSADSHNYEVIGNIHEQKD